MARVTKAQRREQKRREQRERELRETRRRTVRAVLVGGGVVGVLVAALVFMWPSAAAGDTSAEAWDLPSLDGDGRVGWALFRQGELPFQPQQVSGHDLIRNLANPTIGPDCSSAIVEP